MQQTIGPYRVEGEIGRGGMGVVYRAFDPRLDRSVAIKALPEELASDPMRLERFEREARTLAQVSHPNIAGIHGVEEQNGKRYLVLEFVDGETLADKIDRGPIELDEAVELACQVAAGVGAAHDAGVIHRDLKPANIRITPDGVAKVLDFGLARHDEGKSSSGSGNEPTITTPLHLSPTSPGAVLGTAAYMSPEQARGRRVDKRTDIWSFGVVLFEMLTGSSPFVGETASDSIGAVLHKDPDLSRVPPNIRHVLERCLDRDKDKRFRDIGDVRIELQAALKNEHTGTGGGTSKVTLIAVALAAALIAGAAGVAAGWFGKPTVSPKPVRLSIAAPNGNAIGNPYLAPDGSMVLYASWSLEPGSKALGYFRRLDEFEAVPIPATRGGRQPAFSPSGAWVSYMSPVGQDSSEFRIVKMAVGKDLPPVPIAVLPDWAAVAGYNYIWLTEDRLVFTEGRTGSVRFVNTGDGTIGEPVKLDLGGYSGTYELLLCRVDDTRALCRLYKYGSNGYQQDIGLLDVAAAKVSVILENSAVARVGPDGSLLFTRGSTLYGSTFDLEHRKVGTPVQLVAGLRSIGPYQDAEFDVSSDGTIAFLPGGEQGSKRHLEFRLPDGTAKPLPLEPRAFEESLAVSPDESRMLVVICSANKLFEIWGTELDSPRLRRLRGLTSSDLNYPQFAKDNDTFVYMRSEGGKVGMEAASFDGHFEPYWVVEPVEGFVAPCAVDPIRNTVLCVWERPEGFRLYKADLKKGSQLTPVFADSANRESGDYSPDGSMLAYTSDETGRREAYVCAIHDDGSLGRPVAVTIGGAVGARWSRSPGTLDAKGAEKKDRQLVVFSNNGPVSYSITPGERPRVGPAEPLGYDRKNMVGRVDQLSGGRRLLIVKGENETPATHAELILNWYGTASKMIRGK